MIGLFVVDAIIILGVGYLCCRKNKNYYIESDDEEGTDNYLTFNNEDNV
jgi:hypothetical protein